MLPESRKQGLLLRRSIVENVTLPHLNNVSYFGLVRGRVELLQTQTIKVTLGLGFNNFWLTEN